MTTKTNDLNSEVVTLCNARGGFVWRSNTGAFRKNGRMIHYGYVGSGDVIGLYHGFFISIETKTGRDKVSDKQLEFAEYVTAVGGFACFVHDLDEAIEFLDMIDAKVARAFGAQTIPF